MTKEDTRFTLWVRYRQDLSIKDSEVETTFFLIPDSDELSFRKQMENDWDRASNDYTVTYLDKARIFLSDLKDLEICVRKTVQFYGL